MIVSGKISGRESMHTMREPFMDYIRIQFCNDFDKASSRFRKTLDGMFHNMMPMFSFSESAWKPQIDISETPEEVIILSEIPGVNKEDLELEINARAVRIFGRRTSLPDMGNARYRLAEIQYGQFQRILFMPVPINIDIVSATYSNGFLKIRVAKLHSSRTYKIPIQEG